MARQISSDETKQFIEWLWDEHDIEFTSGGEELPPEHIKALWDKFVDGD